MSINQNVPTFDTDLVSIYRAEPEPEITFPDQQSKLTRRVAARIRELAPGELLMLPGDFDSFQNADKPHAVFAPDRTMSEGRTLSKQRVKLGWLALSTELDTPSMRQVAYKPYDTDHADIGMPADKAVAHDWAASTYLNKLKSNTAFEPFAVGRERKDNFVPIFWTLYQPGAISMDNIFRLSVNDSMGRLVVPLENWARVGLYNGHYGLGYLHGAKIIHNDSFPQNLAQMGANKIFFNDTTSFRPFNKNEKTLNRNIARDVHDFLSGVLLFPRVSSTDMRATVEKILSEDVARGKLFEAYLNGAREGAAAAGYDKTGTLLRKDVHERIIAEVIKDYIKQGA